MAFWDLVNKMEKRKTLIRISSDTKIDTAQSKTRVFGGNLELRKKIN